MTDRRIIACEDCGGAGYLSPEMGWEECPACLGTGSREITVRPITQADLTAPGIQIPCSSNIYIVEDDSE